MMRIGLIADIHGNLAALQAVRSAMGNVDTIWCAGDMTGYGPRPNEVIETLQSWNAVCIAGNHDVYLSYPPPAPNALLTESLDYARGILRPEYRDWLANLPCHRALCQDGVRVLMAHGSPWNPQEEYIYPDFADWERFSALQDEFDVIVLGHTHRPLVRQIGNLLVVNPGSVGQPRDNDWRASFAIFDTKTRQITLERAEYNIARVVGEIGAAGLNPQFTHLLTRYQDAKMNSCATSS